MIKHIILLVLLTLNLHGQDSPDDDIKDTASTLPDPHRWGNKTTPRPVIEPTYTHYYMHNRVNSKNQAFPEFNNYSSVGININCLGSGDVGFLGLIVNKEVTISFNVFLPLHTSPSDTLIYKFNGFNFYIDYGKDLFYSNKTLDILPTYGYGWSLMKLQKKTETELIHYRNPAFIFNFLLELRLNLIDYKTYKLLSFGLKGGYQLDCSNPNWRRKGKLANDINKYRQSGSLIQGFISFNFW